MSRSTHITGSLLGVGFVAVGLQRLAEGTTALGVVCVVGGFAFLGWHVRRLVILSRSDES